MKNKDGLKKAVGLISGGLDSTLSARIVKDLGFYVVGLHFYTGFCITGTKRRIGMSSKMHPALVSAKEVGIELRMIDVSEEYIDVVTRPAHGYGKNVNPCIDCRIMMLKKAKQIMEEEGALFVFTGEVVGQRPMSQFKNTLRHIEKEAGLQNRILRPLCAKVLPPTEMEKAGIIEREMLFDITGRSRKRQLELVKEFGIENFQSPAGGCCYLTDQNYAKKFRDLLTHTKKRPCIDDFITLSVGRHFRISEDAKVIVGRNKGENAYLERSLRGCPQLRVKNAIGATAVLEGFISDENLKKAASIVLRYSKARYSSSASVSITFPDGKETEITATPADDDYLEEIRI